MMDAVHVRRHDDETTNRSSQGSLKLLWLNMRCCSNDLENENRQRRVRRDRRSELDDHGEDDFQRMETDSGREIKIQIAVMTMWSRHSVGMK